MGEGADLMNEYGRPDDRVSLGESDEAAGTGEILVEIEQTRIEMSGTIDALQEKLNPDRLKEQVAEAVQEQIAAAKEQVTEAVQEQVEVVKGNIHDATIGRAEEMVSNVGRSGLVETIKQNPVPAALAALGLSWLWAQRSGGSSSREHNRDAGGRTDYGGGQPSYRRGQAYRTGSSGDGQGQGYGGGQGYYGPGPQGDESLGDKVGNVAGQARDTVGDVTGQAKDKVADVAGQAKEQVGQLAGQAQDQVGEWGGQVQSGAQQAWSSFDRMLHENPLGVSAAAIALGLAVGMSLPETPFEDKLMGEARDNVMEKAQTSAQETMQKVGQVAQQVQQTATETAKDAAQKQGLTGSPQQSGTPQGATKQPQSSSQQASGTQNMPKPQIPQSPPPARTTTP